MNLFNTSLGSVLIVALAIAIPANAVPRPLSQRTTPDLSLTAQLQLADT